MLAEDEYIAEVDADHVSLGNTLEPIWVKRSLGYDDVFCVWQTGAFADDGKAANAFLQLFLPEMALRYSLVSSWNRRLFASMQLSQKLSELIEIYESTGVRAASKRLFKGGRMTRRLSLQIIRHQTTVSRDREADYQKVRDFYATGASDVFRPILEADVSDRLETEESGTRDIIALLEARRAADVNGMVLITSALIGGGVGSAVTTLLAR